MVSLGSNLAKLTVGRRSIAYPPAKAVDGVLKSHLLIGQKLWGNQPEALRNYFMGLAELSANKNNKLRGFNLYI